MKPGSELNAGTLETQEAWAGLYLELMGIDQNAPEMFWGVFSQNY